ncbi:MAG: hypothetical protein H8D96_20655 [Desulfobacterales bacterium]|uniref:Uncharacterized protein n=1 Tax=Candidatus Desulfatibia vada TaxID=2841696 RepID=A0A8J6P606_9BACT|nr:hypothetical protein [Candidatus Desulfatibia vada]
MIDKAAILAEVISTIGALASILWLFLDPGPEPFAASLVCLAVILGIGVRSQVKLAKMQDDALLERLNSIREIMQVTDDIPRIPADELLTKLNSDEKFCKSLTLRIVRLFGLRRERIPFLEPEIIDLIDNEFEPFYSIGVGLYTFKSEKLHEFSVFAVKLANTVRELERKLTEEHRKRF